MEIKTVLSVLLFVWSVVEGIDSQKTGIEDFWSDSKFINAMTEVLVTNNEADFDAQTTIAGAEGRTNLNPKITTNTANSKDKTKSFTEDVDSAPPTPANVQEEHLITNDENKEQEVEKKKSSQINRRISQPLLDQMRSPNFRKHNIVQEIVIDQRVPPGEQSMTYPHHISTMFREMSNPRGFYGSGSSENDFSESVPRPSYYYSSFVAEKPSISLPQATSNYRFRGSFPLQSLIAMQQLRKINPVLHDHQQMAPLDIAQLIRSVHNNHFPSNDYYSNLHQTENEQTPTSTSHFEPHEATTKPAAVDSTTTGNMENDEIGKSASSEISSHEVTDYEKSVEKSENINNTKPKKKLTIMLPVAIADYSKDDQNHVPPPISSIPQFSTIVIKPQLLNYNKKKEDFAQQLVKMYYSSPASTARLHIPQSKILLESLKMRGMGKEATESDHAKTAKLVKTNASERNSVLNAYLDNHSAGADTISTYHQSPTAQVTQGGRRPVHYIIPQYSRHYKLTSSPSSPTPGLASQKPSTGISNSFQKMNTAESTLQPINTPSPFSLILQGLGKAISEVSEQLSKVNFQNTSDSNSHIVGNSQPQQLLTQGSYSHQNYLPHYKQAITYDLRPHSPTISKPWEGSIPSFLKSSSLHKPKNQGNIFVPLSEILQKPKFRPENNPTVTPKPTVRTTQRPYSQEEMEGLSDSQAKSSSIFSRISHMMETGRKIMYLPKGVADVVDQAKIVAKDNSVVDFVVDAVADRLFGDLTLQNILQQSATMNANQPQ